jgi:MFS family permease
LLSRSPGFAALVVARAVSVVGDGIGTLALVLHVQADQGTGTAIGLLLLAASLPRLLSPLTGTLADRVDRRSVLAAGELGQGALLLVAVLWLPPLPILLALLLAKATIVTISEAAGAGAVPSLVDDADLPAANAILGGLRQGGEVLGPLLGGLVVAAGGVRAGLAVDALTFLVSVPLLLRLPRLPALPPEAGIGADALAGLRYAMSQPLVRNLTIGFFLIGLTAGDDVALPFLAGELGAGERGTGTLYAAVGAGLILGYLVLARGGRRLAGLVLGAGVAAAGNVATGLAPGLVAAVAFQVVRGLGLAAYETSLQTTLQRGVAGPMLGRVFANVYGAANLAACIALLAAGPLLDATSARTVLLVSGGAGVLSAGAHFLGSRPARWPSRSSPDSVT